MGSRECRLSSISTEHQLHPKCTHLAMEELAFCISTSYYHGPVNATIPSREDPVPWSNPLHGGGGRASQLAAIYKGGVSNIIPKSMLISRCK